MRFYFLITVFSLVQFSSSAQTKLIAHKSHSGSMESFRLVYETGAPDLEGSNFGRFPEEVVCTAALDSLIYVSDTMSIMVTSQHCKKTYSTTTKVWRAGRDTVSYHPLFSKKHALDSIKKILQQQYHFKNPIEKIKFVGYDNKKDSLKRINPRYVFTPRYNATDSEPADKRSLVILGIVAFSFLSGGLSWMLSKNRS